jgi:hypothetical protein
VIALSSLADLRSLIRSSFGKNRSLARRSVLDGQNFWCIFLSTLYLDFIVLETQGNPSCVINSRLDLDGACPHQFRFHRFRYSVRTDEDYYPEKESGTSLTPSPLGSVTSDSLHVLGVQGLAFEC